MNEILEKLLELDNKNFIENCFLYLKNIEISDDDLAVLINIENTNKFVKDRNRYTYPIIKEVPVLWNVTNEMYIVNGNRRYYSDKFYFRDKAYILCNDWYYPTPEKKNTKDTRTPFLRWIEKIENKY